MKMGMVPNGAVVISSAGKDANGIYVVVGQLEGPYVWIADGRKYTVDKPKKKNVRHLRMLETTQTEVFEVSKKISNEWIRSIINQFKDMKTREVSHV